MINPSRVHRSFYYALQGWQRSLRQPNMRLHLLAAVVVLVWGWWLQLTYLEWALIFLSMGLVVTAELFNTAVEALGDAISKEHRHEIGHAKDLAAGAVLAAAATAVVIGVLVLLRRVVSY